MRWLEVRRHSLTKKGAARGRGSHLSAQGVALARAIGAELGSVAYVVTSASPRAVETAIAMGLAVDDTVDPPSGYAPGEVEFHEQWTWAQPYVRYAELIARGGGLGGVARAHRAVWVGAVEQADEGEVALFVGHGGGIEPALVASWGANIRHAARRYSCRSPPSRSRRCTGLERASWTGSESADGSGDASRSARCGR